MPHATITEKLIGERPKSQKYYDDLCTIIPGGANSPVRSFKGLGISPMVVEKGDGEFMVHVYESTIDGVQHIALVKGNIANIEKVLVRVHSECLTGDVFESRRCDCGSQLKQSMQRITEEGSGVIVYLRGHEGRGIGLGHKVHAYQLQDEGRDTVEANVELGLPIDSREYGIGAQILVDLGVKRMKLLTNNPAKYTGLSGYDLEIAERVPLLPTVHEDNKKYLTTKKNKMGHLIDL